MTSITVFAEYFPPYMGSDLRIFQLSKNLALQGHDVSIVVTPPPRRLAGLGELEDSAPMPGGRNNAQHEGLTGYYLRLPRAIVRAWRVRSSLVVPITVAMLFIQAFRKLTILRPRLVVLAHPSFISGLVGFLAAKLAGRKVVLDYPDLWAPLVKETLGADQNPMKIAIIRIIEHFLVRGADRVVAASTPIADFARRTGAKKVIIIPNGVDLSQFVRTREGPPDRFAKTPKIMYVGRFEYWAGLDTLIDSAPLVLKTVPDAEFVLIGDGSCRKDLVRRIETKGLQGAFKVLGPVPYVDIPKFISSADVGVVPFNGDVAAQVALPIKVFEYMAMGKPVVASDTPAMRDLVRNGWNGVLVKSHSEKDLAHGIIRLLENRQLADRLAGHALREMKSRYSWTHLSQGLASVITELG